MGDARTRKLMFRILVTSLALLVCGNVTLRGSAHIYVPCHPFTPSIVNFIICYPSITGELSCSESRKVVLTGF